MRKSCNQSFFDVLEKNSIENKVVVSDADLAHRLHTVVRMEPQETCIIFNREYHAQVTLHSYVGKKACEFVVHDITKNNVLHPHITVYLPLLKRDAFEDAIYNMVELGACVIQPIITKKIQRSWGGIKENERVHKIIVAAAEQSKNFAFPQILEPISLEVALENSHGISLYFDPTGMPLWQLTEKIREQKIDNISLMVGPEGDLTPEEKNLVQKSSYIFCALTPTILRAVQAASLAVGSVRSLV